MLAICPGLKGLKFFSGWVVVVGGGGDWSGVPFVTFINHLLRGVLIKYLMWC